jgi:hypothetical protein
MSIDDAADLALRSVSQLPPLRPDERRSAQVRARCRAQLRRARKPRRRLGPVLFTGLCVIYVSALVLDVLRLQGVL